MRIPCDCSAVPSQESGVLMMKAAQKPLAVYLIKIQNKLHDKSGFWLNHCSLDDPKCFNLLWYLDMSTELTKYFVLSCHSIIKLATKEDLKILF